MHIDVRKKNVQNVMLSMSQLHFKFLDFLKRIHIYTKKYIYTKMTVFQINVVFLTLYSAMNPEKSLAPFPQKY